MIALDRLAELLDDWRAEIESVPFPDFRPALIGGQGRPEPQETRLLEGTPC